MAIDPQALASAIKQKIDAIIVNNGAVDNAQAIMALASSIADSVNEYGGDIEQLGGKYAEIRYKASETKPAQPTDLDPEGWDLQPPQSELPLWFIVAYKQADGTAFAPNSTWSDPVRIDGKSAQTVFKSFVFTRTNETPATPEGGNYLSPVPTTAGWSDGVPSGDEELWISTRIFTDDGLSPQQDEWTTPRAISNTVDIEFQYSDVDGNPEDPDTAPLKWSTTPTPNTIWMATRKLENGAPLAWEVVRVKGEKGGDGVSVLVVYAEDSNGSNQSLTAGARKYVQYVEYVGAPPTLPVSGTFVKFIGEDGEPVNSIWPIYADTENGSNQSFNPTGKSWITFYESMTEPVLPVTATFVKYVGTDGVDGTDGNSVAIIYASDAEGNDQSFNQGDRAYVQYYEYVGIPPSLPVSGTFVRFIGEDGQPANSIWAIYATSSAGANQSFSPIGKDWVTFYESVTEPTLPVSATFVKYVGADGINGIDGTDGMSVLVVYAEDAAGNNQSLVAGSRRFINYYEYTGAKPTLPISATFVEFVGEDGTQGQGVWPIYASNSSGTSQSFDPTGKTWVTFYESTTKPTLPVSATFVKYVGEDGAQGPQGVQGPKGADGVTYYTWIRYADDANGNGISNDPTGKEYIGFAYNKPTATESNTPSDYTWSLIKGEDGVAGPPGEDGKTTYTWIKYADVADGTGMYDIPNANTQYIGIAVNKLTPTESTDKTDYTWSKFKGDQGAKGDKGDQGEAGKNSIFGYLTNEVHMVPATEDGTVISLEGASGYFHVFDGTTDVTDQCVFSIAHPKMIEITIDEFGYYKVSSFDSGYEAVFDFANNQYFFKVASEGSATLLAVYNGVTIEKQFVITKSLEGTSAKILSLSATSQVFEVDNNGVSTPSVVQLTAKAQNIDISSIQWDAYKVNVQGTETPITIVNDGVNAELNFTDIADSTHAVITVSVGDYTDTMTIVVAKDGADGAIGAGFYSKTIATNKPTVTASYLTNHFKGSDVANRNPVVNDIFFVTWNNASDAYQFNGTSWNPASLVINGSIIASGTIAGDRIQAGTSISAPNITGGSVTGSTINNGSGTFTVDSAGNMVANSATINGTITAGSTITGSLFQTSTSGTRVVVGNSTYPLWYGSGAVSAANGNFYVDKNGQIVTNEGFKISIGSSDVLYYDSSANVLTVKARLILDDGTTINDESDIRGHDGENAIVAVLSNEAHVLPANSSGTVSSYSGSGTTIRAFDGVTALTYETGTGFPTTNGRFRVAVSASSITAGSISGGGTTTATVANASNMTSDKATITFTINVRSLSGQNVAITKTQAFSKSKQGATGSKGDKGDKGDIGSGFYSVVVATTKPSITTAYLNGLFTGKAGRSPVVNDTLFVSWTNASDAYEYNGSSWNPASLVINGNVIASGTIAGDRLIAGTSLSAPVILSGQIQMVGSTHMKITTATPFGPNDLIEWYGPKNSYTYDDTNHTVKFDGLTKANAIMYLSASGEAYFGGSIIAGTLRNSAQSSQLGSASVTVGPFGSNGGLIEIKCSVNVSHSTGLVSGPCPLVPSPPGNPTATLKLYRDSPGTSTLVAEQTFTGTYECLPEDQEHIEFRQVSGGFTFTDNLQSTLDRTYRLQVAVFSMPLIANQTTQRISLVTEEA